MQHIIKQICHDFALYVFFFGANDPLSLLSKNPKARKNGVDSVDMRARSPGRNSHINMEVQKYEN